MRVGIRVGVRVGIGAADRVLESVEVTPATLDGLTVPDQDQLTATAHYSDASTLDVTLLATWTTEDDHIVEVGNGASGGVVTGVGAGTATVTATYQGESDGCEVTVV